LAALRPFDVGAEVAGRDHLPAGLARPILAVPVDNHFDCYAIALYGPHASGTDLNEDQRATLAELGLEAGAVWTKLDRESLRRRNRKGRLISIPL
jgi:hypothetical protein